MKVFNIGRQVLGVRRAGEAKVCFGFGVPTTTALMRSIS